ncbi:MAG TPA: DUF4328 domain-containing protein [Candidatus Limnocylindrales bacterium]|nr:DUF4328 domain-containing protein [Candidatus Limnocylindrales bacterium]
MASAPEHWICGSCRSLNEPRAQRCYKCRTPRELVEANPETLLVAGAGASDSSAAVAAAARAAVLGGYRSSSIRAAVAQGLILATAGVAVVASAVGADAVALLLADDTQDGVAQTGLLVVLGLVSVAFAVAALVGWSAWLSRVVDNVPTVGLGWPKVTPQAAFIESFLPGLNLLRVPSIIRDVVTRLEPQGGSGDALLTAAWLGLVGGIAVPRGGAFLASFVVTTVEQAATVRVFLGQIGVGLTVVGAVLLVVLIRRIESAMEARGADVRAEEPAGQLEPSS